MTENDYRINHIIGYGLGHTLHVRFMRNLHNNIVVEKATYYNAEGGVMYVYHDDKTLGRTIEVRNMYIPQEYWKDAELLPMRTTYYKLKQLVRVVYNWVNVWSLSGKQVIACGFDNDNNFCFETSDGCEYIIRWYNKLNITGDIKHKIIDAVEVAKLGQDSYSLRLKFNDGELSISGEDESVENDIREIGVEQYSEYALYDSLKDEFISNGTIVL